MTRWLVPSTSNNAYDIHQLPKRVRVTYPPHPLFGKSLEVIKGYRRDGDVHWIVVLPDRSHTAIKCSWTDHPDRCVPERTILTDGRACPRVLRNLLKLLEHLVGSSTSIQSRSDVPRGGNEHERATSNVRLRAGGLGEAGVEKDRVRKASRDHRHSRPDGKGRTIGNKPIHTGVKDE